MAVCSTPSSPLSVALPDDAATLLKFLLTLGIEATEGSEMVNISPHHRPSLCCLSSRVVSYLW